MTRYHGVMPAIRPACAAFAGARHRLNSSAPQLKPIQMTAPFVPQIALYRNWLADEPGLSFTNYEEMRQWSVRDLDAFWRSIWD